MTLHVGNAATSGIGKAAKRGKSLAHARPVNVTIGERKQLNTNATHYIYVIEYRNRAIYIGCTQNLKRRKSQWKGEDRFKSIPLHKVKVYVILRKRNRRTGKIAEAVLMLFYKLFGQCRLNTAISTSLYGVPAGFTKLIKLI